MSAKKPRKRKPKAAGKAAATGTAVVRYEPPAKRPGPRGGMLYVGGVPGNAAGRNGGRTPNKVRELCRDILEDHELIPRLGRIGAGLIGQIERRLAFDPVSGQAVVVKEYCETPIREQRQAIEALMKFGVEVKLDEDGQKKPIEVIIAGVRIK